jgi:hypothetical protein
MYIIVNSFIAGIKDVWATKFLVGIMLVFKLLTSLILLVPLYLMFSASFAANVKSLNFLTRFDPTLLIDFVYYWRRTLSVYSFMFILTCGIIIILYIFLSGGFWGCLREQKRKRTGDSTLVPMGNRMERFFGYCGRHFGGMFRAGVLMVSLYLFAFLLWVIFLALFGMVAGTSSVWELTSWRMMVKILVMLLLFFWCNMVGDYVRISLIENPGDRFWTVTRKAFRFVLTNLSSTLCLYYLLSLILVGVILFYGGSYKLIGGVSPAGIFVFIAFLFQQVLVVFLSFYRLVFYSSQINLYERISSSDDNTGFDLDSRS